MVDPLIALFGEPLRVCLAALAFLGGGIANATGHPKIRASFTSLGFPGWWRWVTAMIELAAALLLLMPAGRVFGIILGGCVMAAAIAAILARRLYRHLPPPILFLSLLMWVGLGHPA